jgi:hypothetical protein
VNISDLRVPCEHGFYEEHRIPTASNLYNAVPCKPPRVTKEEVAAALAGEDYVVFQPSEEVVDVIAEYFVIALRGADRPAIHDEPGLWSRVNARALMLGLGDLLIPLGETPK